MACTAVRASASEVAQLRTAFSSVKRLENVRRNRSSNGIPRLCGHLEIGNHPLGRNLSPMGQDRGAERGDIGEVPVKAAARHAHGFRQRLGLQRAGTVRSQRLEALVEPS